MAYRAATDTDTRVAARAAAITSVGAAGIHIAVAPSHWSHWLVSGLFFASVAVFQLIWAVLAWTRPPTAVLAAGIAVNIAIAALWVYSRTAGEPFGPSAGTPEPVEPAGIFALLLECYIVMGAAWAWLRRGHRAEPVSGFAGALVLLGANAVAAVAVFTGVSSALRGHDHPQPVAPASDAVAHTEPHAHPAEAHHHDG